MSMQKNVIDEVFPETLKVLSDLIKFQTVSGTSNLALIEYCEKRLSKVGASSFRTSDDEKKRFNLFSTVKGKGKVNGNGIILSGHTDVVPASAKEWSSDPFISKEKNNKVLRGIENKISGSKLGYIAMVYAISKPFSTFCDG